MSDFELDLDCLSLGRSMKSLDLVVCCLRFQQHWDHCLDRCYLGSLLQPDPPKCLDLLFVLQSASR